jgi:predicted dehydrogenase
MAMIRVAVIGAGQWGPNLIRNFHSKETSEVVWIIDPYEPPRRASATVLTSFTRNVSKLRKLLPMNFPS